MTDPIFSAIAEWERLRIEALDDDDSAEFAAAEAVLEVRPQTVAGALALLRFIATIEQDYLGNEWKKGDAIRACADLIEAAP
ncbi:hypothetical protein [Methylocystis sp. ATCC 49242]|uniref:hypothetical protein n=1 Tax=Methylocystis sp. ATCC 49242 TaxID=622637 RepID=UPI00055E6117|nr:hypothetical protein [Methylocystis sp. ATCC 49242]